MVSANFCVVYVYMLQPTIAMQQDMAFVDMFSIQQQHQVEMV